MARFPRHRQGFDHADWLGLVDVSGPFLSIPVLRKTWPELDALDRNARERLRVMHGAGPEWIDYVLRELLEWGDALATTGLDALAMQAAEYDTTVTPSFALVEPGTVPAPGEETAGGDPAGVKPGDVRLLGLICDGPPTKRIAGEAWAATPADRLAQLCRHHDVPLGLATDGRWWALVWAPRGSVTTTAVFDSIDWATAAERDVVRAFVSILRRSRFFAVPEAETLPKLLDASKDSQEDITEALGIQVRQAVELLVAAIGRVHAADVKAGGAGIGDVSAHEVYRGAVAVMMRVVFLLFAEERGLLPSDKELYRASYSVGLLCAELEARAVEGTETDLEHSAGAWLRLLAVFNAVYHGVDHPELRMHPHGGSIFDPDRYAWLPLTIDDRTVLHMLRAVQYVQIGTGKNRERRRLSFATLDVEQIGYVYEGLLSYDAYYATEPVVGLIGKEGYEEEVPLRTLTDLADATGSAEELAERLATEYKASGIGSPRALAKKLAPLSPAEEKEAENKLLAVAGGREGYDLMRRLLPFYGIIRRDLRDLPVVILTDALYVTESPLRKNTGTHYTPRDLAEQVVEGALEPLVYEPGPLQTANKDEWKPKSSQEILSLKVADIAMGSAAFLVAACRYLAKHLVEAWVREDDERVRDYVPRETAIGADAETDPVVIEARRQIIEHCLYGVDINEMAVEMAKLSLWLVSMDPQRPFTFLDDRLITGDSLLGITSLDQLEVLHMDPKRGRERHQGDDKLFDLTTGLRALVAELAEDRRRLVEIDGTTMEGLTKKRELLAETGRKAAKARLLADLSVGAALAHVKKGLDIASDKALSVAVSLLRTDRPGGAGHENVDRGIAPQTRAQRWLATDRIIGSFERLPVHWPLVFPEVFDCIRPNGSGFDAIIGNPPFLGGKKISGSSGLSYREYLVGSVAGGVKGNADLVAYFLLRAHAISNRGGQVGLIGTNTLAQGDTREVGLDQLAARGVAIRKSIKSEAWPSKFAALEYCVVWTSRGDLARQAEIELDGIKVHGINPSLDPISRVVGRPRRLGANANVSFIGCFVNGIGFVLSQAEATSLVCADPRNSEVVVPYLNGQDLNSRPDGSPSRWIIDFREFSLSQASEYPLCLEIVRNRVKPKRDLLPEYKKRVRDAWWRYEHSAPTLREATAGLDRCIALARVSRTAMPLMVSTGPVMSEQIVVFATSDLAALTLLSSAHHYWWAISHASSMKADLRYTPSDVFETFPLPELTQEMRMLGAKLDKSRWEFMRARRCGLTATYNLVHSEACHDSEIMELRQIHRVIDEAVCRAYGWNDLIPQLDHGFHRVGRDTRFVVGPGVQREIVDRLLELNHERYEAEVAAGLHDKKTKKTSRLSVRRTVVDNQGTIF